MRSASRSRRRVTNSADIYQYGYDHDSNRLRKVNNGSTANYSYDALGRRIVGGMHQFHSDSGQIIEERNNYYSPATMVQNVWSLAYQDCLVLRDRNTDGTSSGNYGLQGSGLDERVYVQQDANWNVTAVVQTSGSVVERYLYDPYGKPSYLDGNWGSRGSSAYDWKYLHQGGRYENGTGLYHFGAREFSPTLGRWMQQDPLGYVDGPNMYQGLVSSPVNYVDPNGTDAIAAPTDPMMYFNFALAAAEAMLMDGAPLDLAVGIGVRVAEQMAKARDTSRGLFDHGVRAVGADGAGGGAGPGAGADSSFRIAAILDHLLGDHKTPGKPDGPVYCSGNAADEQPEFQDTQWPGIYYRPEDGKYYRFYWQDEDTGVYDPFDPRFPMSDAILALLEGRRNLQDA